MTSVILYLFANHKCYFTFQDAKHQEFMDKTADRIKTEVCAVVFTLIKTSAASLNEKLKKPGPKRFPYMYVAMLLAGNTLLFPL